MPSFFDKLFKRPTTPNNLSFLRSIVSGSFYSISDIRSDSSVMDIKTKIDTMRALAKDSQVATALSYYATDATTVNPNGDIIWATALEDGPKDAPKIINSLFRKWKVNNYARDHILELATIGNLYMPTTDLYRPLADTRATRSVSLDNNTIPNPNFDIIPSYKIPPENLVHIWYQGQSKGFIMNPDDSTDMNPTGYILYPDTAIVHFSLGGLLGDYTIDARNKETNDVIPYDIQFASPMLEAAVQPTQILNLLENSEVLSSMVKIVRFINVDCGNGAEEDEIRDTLEQVKNTIQQQLSINTLSGDAQSYLNPSSPNNLVYLPKINGQDPISITDLNMKDDGEVTDKVLNYYQDKKLSVLGIPKEALNYSSSEGLGGAGAVMSQRSALYANSLQRLETAYINGWTEAMNKYFIAHGHSNYVDQFKLNMNPILTEMSTVQSDRRDAAITQAQSIVDLLKSVGVTDSEKYAAAIIEILEEAIPRTSSNLKGSDIDVTVEEEGSGMM